MKTAFLLALLLLLATYAHAQRSSELSADLPDATTMAIQNKAEKLFVTGKFERSFFIYRNELVPLGDKYAQYMVGFMYMTGQGVAEDKVVASAWIRLAAERGTAEFVAEKQRLMASFSNEEVRGADRFFSELRLEYSDLAVLLASIKRDVQKIEVMLGSPSRRGPGSGAVFTAGSSVDRYNVVERQLRYRLKLIVELSGIEGVSTDPHRVNIPELEHLVRETIASKID